MKLANEAVQDVRRTEARERKGTAEAAVLKGSRWALLKAPESLRGEEHVRLSAVAGLNARVYRAYLLKEELRALFRCGPKAAKEHLRSWLSWASRSNLGPFVKLGRTLHQYRDGVLAAIRLRLSNVRMEGLNNKIGGIKHRAYGFHSFAAPLRDGLPLLLRSSAEATHLKLRRALFSLSRRAGVPAHPRAA